MPRSTPTLVFLAVAIAAAWFGALGPAHRAELFALAAFVLLASFTRGAAPGADRARDAVARRASR
ncbi:MAG: hypothetical protein ABW252_24645 [Polyangiales bacterium]